MNPLTENFLAAIWDGASTLEEAHASFEKELKKMTPATAGIIGRDLLLRREQLQTPEFHLAAYLASDGEAGNDGVLDFADCVSILPQESYERIIRDHDSMAEMPIVRSCDEFSFLAQIEKKFDAEFGEEGEGLLSYLVLGDDLQRDRIAFIEQGRSLDVAALFPRLYARYGHLLKPRSQDIPSSLEKRATLSDFFGELDH